MSAPHDLPPLPGEIAEAARVVILTRTGCCLCDDAIAIARDICTERAISLHLQDVDANPQLRVDWNDHVPVTFVDGVRHAIWALDPQHFRAALDRAVD
ncbi:MAG TPA: glutaredoxin family protein [Miltoncostaeales bacterium]|jgi:glutaredoxin|nr:glutaredoxin family protein [Miltoncostaeales bacterium]